MTATTRSRHRSATWNTRSGKRRRRIEMAAKSKRPPYTVIIQWSDEDRCYVVSLPEWGPFCKTHGNSYVEAAKNAQEVLELLMDRQPNEPPVPLPKLFDYPGAT